MYRIAICDDDQDALDRMYAYCSEILAKMKIEHEIVTFLSAKELESAIAEENFHMICLDIILPEKSGMEIAYEIRQKDETVSIMFTTNSTEYLLEGYNVRPVQYLLKPIDYQKLEQAFRTDISLRRQKQKQELTLQVGKKTYVFPINDVKYIESINHGCKFHMLNEEHFFWMPLSQVEEFLPSNRFCKCHQSFIVNMKHIKTMGSKRVTLADGVSLAIGPRYAAKFKEMFVHYLNTELIT